MSKDVSVGKEILSYCNKCKATLAHLIVSLKAANPYKVTCKTCNGTHNFKDPSKATKKTTRKTTKKKNKSIPVHEVWMDLMKNSKINPQDYSTKTCFQKGDLINHPTFGKGFVDKTFDDTKMEVIFEQDIKTLMHNL